MVSRITLAGFFSLFLVFVGCETNSSEVNNNTQDSTPLLTLLKATDTGVDFINTSKETPGRHFGHYEYFYNGGGVAIGDINNDGLQDVFFAGNDTSNTLYLNEGGFKFKDITRTAKLSSTNWSTGVTMVDINQDGFLDIYVCNSGPDSKDSLLTNQLYINNGDETFTESAQQYGVADSSYSTQAVFFDMDADGDLDLLVVNHSDIKYGRGITGWEQFLAEQTPEAYKKSCNTLYRNEGNNTFTDITKEAGLFRPGFGLGVSVSDFDENGFLDIYITNDYFIPDFLFYNVGNGTFREVIKARASHVSFYGMGCDAADFNNDGLVDLSVVDMTPADHFRNKTLMESMDVERFSYLVDNRQMIPQYMYNTLHVNRGKGIFSEIANLSGVSQTDWSWATLFMDLDNDTYKDLYITNGFKRDVKDNDWRIEYLARKELEDINSEIYLEQLTKAKSIPIPNYGFQNNGDLTFKNKTTDWGLEELSFSNGVAYGDLDNDGDLDLVVNNLESPAFVYRNNASEKGENHFIQFELFDGKANNSVLNSQITVYTGEKKQLVEYSFVRGYASTMQPLAHFGLGTITAVEKVEIKWPDGSQTTIENPTIDTKHRIDKTQSQLVRALKENPRPYFLDAISRAPKITYQHTENSFDDFKDEILLPHQQSTLGPAVAVGDVNGDGFDDFYLGGALGQAGELYKQTLVEGFVPVPQKAFNTDAQFEDTGALFFDADGDGDIDLYVASGGGGDVANNERLLQDRLYLNDGKGIFTRSVNGLPKINSSTLHISENDWDGDGDLDLFVGGRTTPGKYPVAPQSYLLENKKGIFEDKTTQLAPKLQYAGMVTSSVWSDIDQDGKKDILVVGEWMGIKAFVNSEDGFVDKSESFGLTNTTGWWYSIAKGDFDNDGDEDFIVGNVGSNNKFHPSEKKPLHIFSNDFDANGTLDIVLSKLYQGNLTPVRGKECSTQQMPFLEEKFPSYSDFASSTLVGIYGEEKLNEALHYEATNFASVYLENTGNGAFSITNLPMEAQLSPINDMVVYDFDKDGNLDVVVGGNMFNTEVETPAYDAGKGLYMQGKGDGTFATLFEVNKSGIYMPYNVKGLRLISISQEKRPAILVANNNTSVQLFAWIR
tara:strand:- start:274 stop:3624 length:3351 start_codon:yes stop_codon:yes gene_type:complete